MRSTQSSTVGSLGALAPRETAGRKNIPSATTDIENKILSLLIFLMRLSHLFRRIPEFFTSVFFGLTIHLNNFFFIFHSLEIMFFFTKRDLSYYDAEQSWTSTFLKYFTGFLIRSMFMCFSKNTGR